MRDDECSTRGSDDAEVAGGAAAPDLQALERLVDEWHRLRGDVSDTQGFEAAFRHPERIAERLAPLRLGPPPDQAHEDVSRAWQPFACAWASQSTLDELERALRSVEATMRSSEEGLAAMRAEIETRRRRVDALTVLGGILDELLSSSAGNPEAERAGNEEADGSRLRAEEGS